MHSLSRHAYTTWLHLQHRKRLEQFAAETLPQAPKRRAPPGRLDSLQDQFELMKEEFGGCSRLTFELYCAVISARRGVHPEKQAELIRYGLLHFPQTLYGDMNTRWLVSFLNTLSDHGRKGEAEAARALTTFLHMLKVYETLFKPGQIDPDTAIEAAISHMHALRPYREPANFAGLELWDYMFTMDLANGDVIANLFERLDDEAYPVISTAYGFVRSQLEKSNTVFAKIILSNKHTAQKPAPLNAAS